MSILFHLCIFSVTLVAMEGVVTWLHHHVMHGWGWKWHASHHRPSTGRFEANDVYSLGAAAVTVPLFIFSRFDSGLWWMALGITAYGLLYTLLHDGLIHRRFGFAYPVRHPYLRRLINAHHLHHAIAERQGAVSYGFLYAPPVSALRRRLVAQRKRHAR